MLRRNMRLVHLLPLLVLGFVTAVSSAVHAFVVAAGTAPSISTSHHSTKTSLMAEASSSTTSTQQRKKRQPWNVFRFLKQSSKFVEILPRSSSSSSAKTLVPGSVVWEPNDQQGFAFAALDDVVMGGASSSSVANASGRWTGTVTDANNGGFVGIRSTPSFEYDLSKCQGLEITVRTRSTQKRRYKLGVRDSKEFNGIVWNTSFMVNGGKSSATSPTTTKVRIPFNKLTPTLFARTVPDAAPFNKGRVVGIQFVFSKFEYNGDLNDTFQVGDVDLEIVSIKAY